VLAVLLFHFVGNTQPTNAFERVLVGAAGYGLYGVDLFFVLSGFLITGILYDSRSKPNYFRNFYMRRLLRIFPLYYGVLVLVFFVAPLVPFLRGPTLDSLIDRQGWAWLYAVNIYIAKEGQWSFSYLNHFWSLAVEEHFYLFWPWLVYYLVGIPRRLMALCLVLTAVAFLGRGAGVLLGFSWWTTYVFTPLRLDGLALGSLMAVVVRQPRGLDTLTGTMPSVALTSSVVLLGSFVWTHLVSSKGVEVVMLLRSGLVQVLCACLLLWALTTPKESTISRFLRSRAMIFLGTYSYGLYVYHHFISYYCNSNGTEFMLATWLGSHSLAVFVQAGLGISASIALAYSSYEYFEKRFLAMKRFFYT
jgi:peptidoglycan/LPS O-acetylase OafA/YrhL